eukprot:539613-Prymnesium_polylepis.1
MFSRTTPRVVYPHGRASRDAWGSCDQHRGIETVVQHPRRACGAEVSSEAPWECRYEGRRGRGIARSHSRDESLVSECAEGVWLRYVNAMGFRKRSDLTGCPDVAVSRKLKRIKVRHSQLTDSLICNNPQTRCENSAFRVASISNGGRPARPLPGLAAGVRTAFRTVLSTAQRSS